MIRMLVVLALAGCVKAAPEAPAEKGLLTYTPPEGEGAGADPWGPQTRTGEGCDALAACCAAASPLSGAVEQLCGDVALREETCPELRAQVAATFGMFGRGELPAECAP